MKIENPRIGLILIDDETGKNYATSISKEENDALQLLARTFKTISTHERFELILKDKEVQEKITRHKVCNCC